MHLKLRPGSAQLDAVQLDGSDIGHAVRGVTLALAPGELPHVTLDLAVYVQPVELADPIITVPEPTVAALEALGWMPPAEAAELRKHVDEIREASMEADQ